MLVWRRGGLPGGSSFGKLDDEELTRRAVFIDIDEKLVGAWTTATDFLQPADVHLVTVSLQLLEI